MAETTYEQELVAKLEAARKRVHQGRQVKALKDAAPDLFEIIHGEIKLILDKMTAPEPLTHDQYLSMHGQARGIAKIRDLLDSKEKEEVAASQEVAAIQGNLEQIRDDKK
jgi:hypothetical protein